MIQISASLLAADYARLGEEVQRAELAGVDSFHFDMMDGHYVPNLALTPHHLIALRPYTSLPFHVHLELSNPDEVLNRFSPFRADTIIVQWNTLHHVPGTFDRIRSRHEKVGLGLNPDDQIENVVSFFHDLNLLLILGVDPGFGGQTMRPGTLERLRAARAMVKDLNPALIIAVDGGVNASNASSLIDAGADCLIIGTALFQAKDMRQILMQIRGSTARSPGR